jgi:hypothetical protein
MDFSLSMRLVLGQGQACHNEHRVNWISASIAEAKGSHAIYVSQPEVVANLIAQAEEGGR